MTEKNMIYEITITNTATYIIKANDQELAEDMALERFNEREPDIDIKTFTEEELECTEIEFDNL